MKSTKRKLQYFAIALLAVILLALTIQYMQFNNILKSSKEANIIGYNQDLKNRLNKEVEYNKEYLAFLSEFLETISYEVGETEEYFKALVDDNNIMRSIYFTDHETGDFISSDVWEPEEGFDLRERTWYINTIGKEEAMVSDVYVDALDGSSIITLSKSIYDRDKLLGVLAIDIKLEDVTEVVRGLTNELLEDSFLIDSQGNILGYKSYHADESFAQEDLEKLSEERHVEFKIKRSGTDLVKINNTSGYLFYDTMDNTDWIVASFISLQSFDNSWASLWTMFIIVLTMAMLVFFVFSYAFKRYFIAPTMEFYNDIKKINLKENQGYRMPSHENDYFHEVRELANEIIGNAESLMIEQETNTEEIIAQNEELEASYNQLAAYEQELRHEYNKNKAVNEAIPDALFIIDKNGDFIDTQVSHEVELYIVEEEYLGKNIGDLFSKEIMESSKTVISNVINNNIVEKLEFEIDGYAGIQKYEIRMAKMDEDHVLAVARNITKEKKMEEQLIDLSYKDQLTNLYNKRYFEKKILQIDDANNLPISIIYADINGLKLINDSFGHNTGDQLIKNVGKFIQKGCRAVDTIFRVSGDEFVVVLRNTDRQVAEKVVNRIKNISRNTKLDNDELRDLDLIVSFGISTKEDMKTDIHYVVKKAEENMYYHKLYEGQQMRLKTIDSMIESIYRRSPNIQEYTKYAKKYAEKLAGVLNLSSKRRENIEKTIYYQEIGKITFSDELLQKTGGFTQIELEERNKHPGVGYRILSTINEMIEVAKYVLYHHERYDGLGYPKALKGEEIPLESRIVSLINFYIDLLREDEYKDPASEDTIKKLREKAGTELDPKLVDIFIKEVLQAN